MLQSSQHGFDLPRSCLGAGEIQRYRAADGRLARAQPIKDGLAIAFEQVESLAEQPSGAQEAIGLVRRESSFVLSSKKRPARDVDELQQPVGGDTGIARKTFITTERQAVFNGLKQLA